MTGLGYRVAICDSTWPTLDFIRTSQPAVLVCDVVMLGGLGGLGLAPLTLVGHFDVGFVITAGFSAGIVGYHNGRVPNIGAVLPNISWQSRSAANAPADADRQRWCRSRTTHAP